LAFFDFPGLDLGHIKRCSEALHHVAISVEPMRWEQLRDRLLAAGVEILEHGGILITSRIQTILDSN
jgi:hypothetical protein